jgi:hypothetical protein
VVSKTRATISQNPIDITSSTISAAPRDPHFHMDRVHADLLEFIKS